LIRKREIEEAEERVIERLMERGLLEPKSMTLEEIRLEVQKSIS